MPKRKRSNTYPIASQSFQPVKRARLSRDGTGNTKTHEPDPTSLHGSVHLKQKDLPNGKEGRNVYRLSSPSPSVAYALDEQNSLNYTNKKPDRQQGTSQHAYERKAAENTLGLHTMDIPRPKDADRLIRRCDFPAMLDNDLRRLMFPSSTSEDFEEEILWNIESLADSLADPDQNFRQIRNHNGEVLGFACWSIFNTKLTIDFVPHQRDKGHGNKSQGSKATRLPSSLDQQTWRSVSRKLAVERRRVLEGIDRVWRKLKSLKWRAAGLTKCRIDNDVCYAPTPRPRHRLTANAMGLCKSRQQGARLLCDGLPGCGSPLSKIRVQRNR